MADTWMTSDRKKGLLDYANQMRGQGGFTKDDALAAGYSEKEYTEAFPDSHYKYDKPYANTGTVKDYTPTLRDKWAQGLHDKLFNLGLSDEESKFVSGRMFGTFGSGNEGISVADMSPLGIPMGIQEGARQFERGNNSGSLKDEVLGVGSAALSVLGALPGAVSVEKGLSKVAGKLVDMHDPNALNIFLGVGAKNAPLEDLKAAKGFEEIGMKPRTIWEQTGWFKGPDDKWRWEVSDKNVPLTWGMEDHIQEGASDVSPDWTYGTPSIKTLNTTVDDGIEHKQVFENYPSVGHFDLIAKNGSLGDGSLGSYSSSTGKIQVGSSDVNQFKSTLLHEMQHAIDDIESHASGANPNSIYHRVLSTVENLAPESWGYLKAKANTKFYAEQAGRYEDELKGMDAAEAAFKAGKIDVRYPWQDDTDPPLTLPILKLDKMELHRFASGLLKEAWKNDNTISELKKTLGKDYITKLDDFVHLTSDFPVGPVKQDDFGNWMKGIPNSNYYKEDLNLKRKVAAHKTYQNNVGEVFARLTQARKDMSATDRIKNFPLDMVDTKGPMWENYSQLNDFFRDLETEDVKFRMNKGH